MGEVRSQQGSLEERVVALHRGRATGALTVQDGPRRRAFYFRQGALVQTASNLKKEAAEVVAERLPGASPGEVLQAQAGIRLGGALGAPMPELTWEENRAPGREHPLDLPRALADALTAGLDDDALRHRLLALARDGHPRATGEDVPSEERLPVSLDVREWIQTLDGRRPLAEAIEFGPPDVGMGARALYLATLLGFVEFTSTSTPDSAVAAAASIPDPGTSQRLARLIADGIPRTPAPVPAEPALDAAEAAIRAEIHRIEQATTHHDVLGLPWDAPTDTLRNAYFAIARTLHPDRMPQGDPALVARASAAFDRAREAWDCFREEGTRQAYVDRVVHGKKTEDELAMERVEEILTMEALFRRGRSFFHAGQIVKAHECFEEAARKVPEQAEFRVFYGYTLWKLSRGRDPEAAQRGRRMLDDALQEGGRDDGFVLLGRVCREEGDDGAARAAFLRALKLNPENKEALRELKRPAAGSEPAGGGGFFSRLFGKKKG